jgi:hypothetical protein
MNVLIIGTEGDPRVSGFNTALDSYGLPPVGQPHLEKRRKKEDNGWFLSKKENEDEAGTSQNNQRTFFRGE